MPRKRTPQCVTHQMTCAPREGCASDYRPRREQPRGPCSFRSVRFAPGARGHSVLQRALTGFGADVGSRGGGGDVLAGAKACDSEHSPPEHAAQNASIGHAVTATGRKPQDNMRTVNLCPRKNEQNG